MIYKRDEIESASKANDHTTIIKIRTMYMYTSMYKCKICKEIKVRVGIRVRNYIYVMVKLKHEICSLLRIKSYGYG